MWQEGIMKKILICVLMLFACFLKPVYADESKTPVKFIYLNGSNTNTEESENDFINGIAKVHPYIKKSLESSDFVSKNMLHSGNLCIDSKPETFFWGFESSQDLSTVDESLNWTSVFSPRIAQRVRSFISHCMHDAIWVQKSYNMQKVINDLHVRVLEASKNNEKVVLLGYSAGSFITYEYLIHKMPAIDLNKILATDSKSAVKPTCLDAVLASRIAIYSASGEFLKNPDKEQVKGLFNNLDNYTDLYCAPDDTLIGVVNYASPLALFYSDRYNHSLEINNYNSYLFEYLKRNDIFMLTVNFADDPMGFPIANNMTIDDLHKHSNWSISDVGHGFFYSKSDVKSSATFIGAHLSYWKHPKKFSKMITDGYIEGYKYFYKLK